MESCVLCAYKHIGEADVILTEVHNGYPQSFCRVLGNLAQAEWHLRLSYPVLMRRVRSVRKTLELNPWAGVDLEQLASEVAREGGYDVEEAIRRREK